jgi:hypothetical protein
MSSEMRNMIDNVNMINESFTTTTSTMEKLINTAIKDGYIGSNEASAQYIMDAGKNIAIQWDNLNPEEKKVFRDKYYNLFLQKIGKK